MKREKITPEDLGSNLSDPHFLDGEGRLIPTSKNGKTKEIGSIKLFYCFDKKKGNLSVSFIKSRDVVGAASYSLPKWGVDVKPTFYTRGIGSLGKERFVDTMLKEYPEVGVWILWNV